MLFTPILSFANGYNLILESKKLLETGNFTDAVSQADQYITLYPQGEHISSALFYKAGGLAQLNKWDEATSLFNKIVREYPDSNYVAHSQKMLSMMARYKGKVDRKNTNNVVANRGLSDQAYMKLLREGQQAINRRDYAKANQNFDAIIAGSQNQRIVGTAKQLKQSIRRYQVAPNIKGVDDSMFEGGVIALRNKDFAKAEELFQKVIDISKNPDLITKAKTFKTSIPSLIQQEKDDRLAAIERYEAGIKEDKRIKEEKQLAFVAEQTKKFSLPAIRIEDKHTLQYRGLVVGETTKDQSVKVYETQLVASFQMERTSINLRLLGWDNFNINKEEFYFHKDASMTCFSYLRKGKGTKGTDCLYFYKDTLIGFKLDMTENSCGNCAIANNRLKEFENGILDDKGFKQVGNQSKTTIFKNKQFIAVRYSSLYIGQRYETYKTVHGVKQFNGIAAEPSAMVANVCVFPKKMEPLLKSIKDKKFAVCNY